MMSRPFVFYGHMHPVTVGHMKIKTENRFYVIKCVVMIMRVGPDLGILLLHLHSMGAIQANVKRMM